MPTAPLPRRWRGWRSAWRGLRVWKRFELSWRSKQGTFKPCPRPWSAFSQRELARRERRRRGVP
ncbi:unnamed protein product, partial [Ectocarpus fasciculatus]